MSQQKIYFLDIIKDIRYEKLKYILFNRFNIGYGTIRVGLGMSISKLLYENIINII